MATAADNAALVVAALDLKLVQDLRGAMRAADIASGRPQPVSPLGPAPTPPPDRFDREPAFALRPVYHPEPRYEPRPVIHPTPRIEFQPPIKVPAEVEVLPPVCSSKAEVECPLAPPWRQPIWETPTAVPPKVKIVLHRTDIINKGSLIDFFI